MKIIEYYILKRVFALTLTYLFIATMLGWTIEMLGKLDFLLSNIKSMGQILYFSVLFLPPTLSLMLPFAFLFTLIQIILEMHNSSEMTALHASGFSANIILRPVFIISIFFCILSFYLANYVTPFSRTTMRFLVSEINSNFITNALKEGEFQKLGKDFTFFVRKYSSDNILLDFIFIDQRDLEKTIYYYAPYASIQKQNKNAYLILKNGEIARKNKKDSKLELLKFDYYSLNLNTFMSPQKSPQFYPKDRSLSFLYHALKEKNCADHKAYKAEFHKRLTDCALPFIFSLINVALLGFPKSQRQLNNLAGFNVFILSMFYYFLNYFLRNRAQNFEIYNFYIYLNISIHIMFYSGVFYLKQNNISKSIKNKA